MTFILVSTWKSLCSGCRANLSSPDTITACPGCGENFDGVMMLAATENPFHATLPHVAPMDHPDVDTLALTWYRPWNARMPYEVDPTAAV